MFKVGVISDTHGYLDPQAVEYFSSAQVRHILHAGDIGTPAVVQQLEAIAPVTVVTGNNDCGLDILYRETELAQLGELKFLVRHIVNAHSPAPELSRRIQRDTPDAVIFGHTHKPFSERFDGLLFFNPGYAGKARLGLPRSVALLVCEGKAITPAWRFLG
jgi:uncharacterized protein